MSKDQISDGESLSANYEGLSKAQSLEWLYLCFDVAVTVVLPKDRFLDAAILYENCPASIKSDILTLGMDNEAVRAKIIEWLKTQFKIQTCQVTKI